VMVFTDGVNDFDDKRAILHVTSVQLSECVAKGRLHWAGSGVDALEPPAEETSAPEGATGETGDGAVSQPPPVAELPAPSAAPKAKNKGGRPKKAK
jgi:hypothetical protein